MGVELMETMRQGWRGGFAGLREALLHPSSTLRGSIQSWWDTILGEAASRESNPFCRATFSIPGIQDLLL